MDAMVIFLYLSVGGVLLGGSFFEYFYLFVSVRVNKILEVLALL